MRAAMMTAVAWIAAMTCLALAQPASAGILEDRDYCLANDKLHLEKWLASCTAFIEAPPKHTEELVAALNNRGNAWSLKGDLDRALKDYDEAIRIGPGYQMAYINRGAIWEARGDDVRALADFDRALHINPYVAFLRVQRGDHWFRKGDYARALTEYKSAVHVETSYAPGLNATCFILGVTDAELDLALADCDKAIRLSNGDANFYDSRALVHFRRGEFGPAIEDADKALAGNGRLASARLLRGLAELHLGRQKDGQTDVDAATDSDPDVAARYAAWGVKP